MKYASQTATIQRDYHWNADSEDFRAVAEEEWLRWHYEYADIPWFGLISRNEKLLFLAGKIPTERYDFVHRRIITFIVLQPENEEEKSHIINLTANLMLGKEEQKFYGWADDLAMAQENQTPIPDWFSTETVPQDERGISIGLWEYPLDEDSIGDRNEISASLGNLVRSGEDFVVAVINYSALTFYKKVCNDLPQDAGIAVFSKSTTDKEKFPKLEPESKAKPPKTRFHQKFSQILENLQKYTKESHDCLNKVKEKGIH